MSVTFTTTGPLSAGPLQAVCGVTAAVLGPTTSWPDAREQYGAHCPDCDTFGPLVQDPADQINMANANAARILDLLGYGPTVDLCGEADPAEFLGRVLLAQALAGPDEGVPAHVVRPGFEDFGRRVGYTEERLAQLAALAGDAAARGLRIVWS